MLKIATWNVNGIRARETQVLEWIERERPDVVCRQELQSTVAPSAGGALRAAGISLLNEKVDQENPFAGA